jgi:phosphoribosylanthranilate isomerase
VEPYAADVDFFILDGAAPGSGQRIGTGIPADFPWPFLLAGGINESNLDAIATCKNCMGVDIASGIETGGLVDLDKVGRIAASLAGFLPV